MSFSPRNEIAMNLPEIVGLQQLCQLLGVNATSINAAARTGRVVKLGHDQYHLQQSIRAYVDALKAKPKTGERERLIKAQADLAELKLAESRNQLIPATQVEHAWATILTNVRQAILAVPTRLPELSTADRQSLESELRDALKALGGHADA
jgi:terminase small subunit / prophage DNA-packing protein